MLKMDVDVFKCLMFLVKGLGEVKVGDIQEIVGIIILNCDYVICYLDDGVEFYVELIVVNGKGYVVVDKNCLEDVFIGLILIDVIFLLVKCVSYEVQLICEGQVLDYDKLMMKVEIDGLLILEDVVVYVVCIVQDQLLVFVNFDELEIVICLDVEDGLEFDLCLLKKVDELELLVCLVNCLKNDNIVYIGDLIQKIEVEMLCILNFGCKLLNEIKEVFLGMGLYFGMDVVDWLLENIEDLVKCFDDQF